MICQTPNDKRATMTIKEKYLTRLFVLSLVSRSLVSRILRYSSSLWTSSVSSSMRLSSASVGLSFSAACTWFQSLACDPISTLSSMSRLEPWPLLLATFSKQTSKAASACAVKATLTSLSMSFLRPYSLPLLSWICRAC